MGNMECETYGLELRIESADEAKKRIKAAKKFAGREGIVRVHAHFGEDTMSSGTAVFRDDKDGPKRKEYTRLRVAKNIRRKYVTVMSCGDDEYQRDLRLDSVEFFEIEISSRYSG